MEDREDDWLSVLSTTVHALLLTYLLLAFLAKVLDQMIPEREVTMRRAPIVFPESPVRARPFSRPVQIYPFRQPVPSTAPSTATRPVPTTPPPSSDLVSVDIEWRGAAQTVILSGSFLNWSLGIPLHRLPDQLWTLTLHLPPGEHEYALLKDDVWEAERRTLTISRPSV